MAGTTGSTGTLFFVHGTGVRQEGYAQALELVRAGLIANDMARFTVVGCQWGDTLGDRFDDHWRELVARTLPPETTPTADPAHLAGADVETSSWEQLLRDPLLELRLVLFASPPPAPATDSPVRGPARDVADVVAEIARHPPEVEGSGLSRDELAAAARTIVASDELTTDGYGTVPATRGIIRVVAQAIVALALARHRFDAPGTEPRAAIDSQARDAVVVAIERALLPGEGPYAAPGGFEGRIRRFVQNRGTAFVRERRLQFMQAYAAPFLADVAFYLRHGDAFREYVTDQLASLEPPVVAVGHSLGGVILVDLLSRKGPGDETKVELLVTAGTQAPLLYALRALEHLSPDDPASTPFTPWLNAYNPNDFLSFCARSLFPHTAGIIEERIEPEGIPFPAAHSAYWMENRLYERIRDVLTAERSRTG